MEAYQTDRARGKVLSFVNRFRMRKNLGGIPPSMRSTYGGLRSVFDLFDLAAMVMRTSVTEFTPFLLGGQQPIHA